MRYIYLILLVFLLVGSPAKADFERGMTLFEQGNYAAAVAELLPLAEAGDRRAQYIVGVVLAQGYTGESDPEAGAAWLERSAEQNYLQAQVELGRMYRTGDGIPEDHVKMVRWYRRAAEQGDVGAQLFVADAYAYGYGVEPDPVEAYVWYEVAMRYWGHLAEHARAIVAERLSEAEIAEARSRAAAIQPPAPAQ